MCWLIWNKEKLQRAVPSTIKTVCLNMRLQKAVSKVKQYLIKGLKNLFCSGTMSRCFFSFKKNNMFFLFVFLEFFKFQTFKSYKQSCENLCQVVHIKTQSVGT